VRRVATEEKAPAMTIDQNDRARSNGSRDPWAGAPTGELGDQVLPRWFVLTAIGAVVAATIVAVVAFGAPGPSPVPVQARRPPPSSTQTTAVGQIEAGAATATPYEAPCGLLDGLRLAGTPGDRAQLRRGLAALCNIALPPEVARDLRALADDGTALRFATFEATGVDSTASLDTAAPAVFVNARFQRTNPLWIAPLVVHDATLLQGDPATARDALAGRRAEAAVCDLLLPDDDQSRACTDARTILALDDPLSALRDAGFR
jgi:hypothetical protein